MGTNNVTTDYTIKSKPVYVRFKCPYCQREVGVPYLDVDYKTDSWNDGATCDCPNCGKEVELGNYEYE